MGLAVSRPAPGRAASSEFTLLSGRTPPQLFDSNRLLDRHTPETDIEVGYVTTFLDGSVALQTNASYQMNFAGQTARTRCRCSRAPRSSSDQQLSLIWAHVSAVSSPFVGPE